MIKDFQKVRFDHLDLFDGFDLDQSNIMQMRDKHSIFLFFHSFE